MSPRYLVISVAAHALVILVGLLLSGDAWTATPMTGNAIAVEMVTLQRTAPSVSDAQEETPSDPVEETQPEEQLETEQETPVQPESEMERDPPAQEEEAVGEQGPPETVEGGFSAVDHQGNIQGLAPGPGTYESRVFNAVRRHFRTSISPSESYRIELVVKPNGSVEVTTIRKSGTDAFDRAVEHALTMANIPPPPPGRTAPAVLRIEFLGPDGDGQ
jgi:outer membrane biosynthesis protein TonB